MENYLNTLSSSLSRVSGDALEGKTQSNTSIDFEEIVMEQIEKVNQAQVDSDSMTEDLVMGKTDDLHSVMIAAEEARIAMELAVQVRNKCVEAYKELNNMQI